MEDNRSTSGVSNKDTAWSKFEEYAKQRVVGVASTTGLPGSSRNPLSPNTVTLPKEDMSLYGREPATDNMILVICELCGRVIKSQALLKHREQYHNETRSHSLSLRRPPLSTTSLPVQTHGQSTSMGGGANTGVVKKSKECDFDRHCGVWIETDKRYCRKSITCKIHSLEMRLKVTGRSRPLNELLKEHKIKKKQKKIEKLRAAESINTPLPTTPNTSQSAIITSPHVPSPFSPSPPPPTLSPPLSIDRSPLPSSAWVYLGGASDDEREEEHIVQSNNDSSREGPLHSLFPKPMAVNRFHSRQMTSGLATFTHRNDSFRSLLVSLTERENDFPQIPQESSRQFTNLCRQRRNVNTYSYLGQHNTITSHYSKNNNIGTDHASSNSTHPRHIMSPHLTSTVRQESITCFPFITEPQEDTTNITSRINNRKRSLVTTNVPHSQFDSYKRSKGVQQEEEMEEEELEERREGRRQSIVKSEFNHMNNELHHYNKQGSNFINGLSSDSSYLSHGFLPSPSQHHPHSLLPNNTSSHYSSQLTTSSSSNNNILTNNDTNHHHSIQSLISPAGHHLIHPSSHLHPNPSSHLPSPHLPSPHLYNSGHHWGGLAHPGGGGVYESIYPHHHNDILHHSNTHPSSNTLQGTMHHKYYTTLQQPNTLNSSENMQQQMSASLLQQQEVVGEGGREGGREGGSAPRLHKLGPQNTYSRQTASSITAPQNITHRTQQVS